MHTEISQIEAGGRSNHMDPNDMRIRRGTTQDAVALGLLAQLDGTLHAGGEVLVAESGGELIAAVPMDEGRAFADPFRHTASAVAVLELRRDQIKASESGAGRRSAALARLLGVGRRTRTHRARASA